MLLRAMRVPSMKLAIILRRAGFLITALVFLLLGHTGIASAYSANDENAFSTQLPFYNSTIDCSGVGSGTATINLTGNTNAQQAFNYFVTTRGLTPELSAAILGNL